MLYESGFYERLQLILLYTPFFRFFAERTKGNCNNEEVIEKQAVNTGINFLDLTMDSSKYLVKVYENEGDLFSFDDDYKFVGEKEVSLVNPLHLTESCFSITSSLLQYISTK